MCLRTCVLLPLDGMSRMCLFVHLVQNTVEVQFFLIFFLDDLSIIESRVLKTRIAIAILCISPSRSVNIGIISLGAPVLGTYMFTIVISS